MFPILPVSGSSGEVGEVRGSDVREISDVDEGVVERGEDACHAEDELAYCSQSVVCTRGSQRGGAHIESSDEPSLT